MWYRKQDVTAGSGDRADRLASVGDEELQGSEPQQEVGQVHPSGGVPLGWARGGSARFH